MFDPNTNLREQLELAKALLKEESESDVDDLIRWSSRLATLVQEMDIEFSSGGVLPTAWDHYRGPGGGCSSTLGTSPSQYAAILMSTGPNRVKLLGLMRELLGYPVNSSVTLLANLPWTIEESDSKERLEEFQEKFAAIGALVEIRALS